MSEASVNAPSKGQALYPFIRPDLALRPRLDGVAGRRAEVEAHPNHETLTNTRRME